MNTLLLVSQNYDTFAFKHNCHIAYVVDIENDRTYCTCSSALVNGTQSLYIFHIDGCLIQYCIETLVDSESYAITVYCEVPSILWGSSASNFFRFGIIPLLGNFIRDMGICVVLAQSGMFVPCSSFIFNPYTAIYSRILGNDNLFKGLSTFG